MEITVEELLKQKKEIQIDDKVNKRIDDFAKKLYESYEVLVKGKEDRDIYILSDYDCDGISSALILKKAFPEAKVIISDRVNEGYGIGNTDALKENDFVIICDMGSSEKETLKEIEDKTHIAPFVIDHHITETKNNRILNFYDGKIKDEEIPSWCTAGLCYHVVESLMKQNKVSLQENDLTTARTYAGIGTIADVVPVNTGHDDNSTIIMNALSSMAKVKEGIEKEGKSPIDDTLTCLLYNCKILEKDHVTTSDIGFNVSPVINAMSRMLPNGGQRAYDVLSTPYSRKTNDDILLMIENNQKRKDLTEEITSKKLYKDFIKDVKESVKNGGSPICFYEDDSIPRGMVGLIAGRITEETGIPTLVGTKIENGDIVISGRNATGYPDMYDLCKTDDKNIECGGHSDAFGMTITSDKTDKDTDIKNTLNKYLLTVVDRYKGITPVYKEPTFLKTEGLTVDKLYSLEPFGCDFKTPTVKLEGVPQDVRVFKGTWFSAKIDGIKVFGRNPELADYPSSKENTSVIGDISISSFKDNEYLQVSFKPGEICNVKEKEMDDKSNEDTDIER